MAEEIQHWEQLSRDCNECYYGPSKPTPTKAIFVQ